MLHQSEFSVCWQTLQAPPVSRLLFLLIKFLGVLLLGDAIQFLIYGPLTAALCKVNPAKMPKKFAKMSMMAVTTTSGAICLPTKMEDAVVKFGVSRKVADFTGPLPCP